MNKLNLLILLSFLMLTGCAAMLVPETNDPYEKLNWAEELYDRQSRPLPAEKLINEAIEICKQRNDLSCLGRAHVKYGFFFRSPSVEKFQKLYKEKGFYDKSATYETRLIKSKEQFEKAISYYEQTKQYDALTHAYLNLGFTYYFMGEHEAECEPYSKSLEYNLKYIQENPNSVVTLPPGYSSYKDYIAVHLRRAGCL